MVTPLPWKVLSRKHVLAKPWMTVRAVEVQLPNGHAIPYCLPLELVDAHTVRETLIRGERLMS